MARAQIITKLMGTGSTDDPFYPQIEEKRGAFSFSMIDVTGAGVGLPSPNSIVVEVENGSGLILDIESDNDYYMLWDEPNPKPPNEPPSAAEWARQRVFMIKQGYTTQDINEAIGQTPHGRNRNTIANDLIGWLKNR